VKKEHACCPQAGLLSQVELNLGSHPEYLPVSTLKSSIASSANLNELRMKKGLLGKAGNVLRFKGEIGFPRKRAR
jgi:hypothetical protein